MKLQGGRAGRLIIVPVAVNATLCAALGVLLGGLRGAQLGLAVGIVLAVLPTIARASAAWLTEPGGLPRLIARETGNAVVRGAAAIVAALARLLGPLADLLQGPILVLRFAAFVVRGSIAALLEAAGRALATPLGLANLGALAVIAVSLAGFEYATPVLFIGLILLILTLLVSENEASSQESSPNQTDNHGA